MIRGKRRYLLNEIEVAVRFSEVDAMNVVWHGNYLKYFEDGREALGAEYQLDYLDIAHKGFFVPIVHSEIDHSYPIQYGSKVKVISRLVDTPAAKIIHEYEIYDVNSGKLAAKGQTIQVFVTHEKELILTIPEFYAEWKAQQNWIEDEE
ncbi:MAG: acyl-CoA thioesterase [Flavobacteriales bacterium]|jgi:acyl-CoA thioester hydrolase|nr:acyl-CoA thioesterase [Flavobacteriales bacterium]